MPLTTAQKLAVLFPGVVRYLLLDRFGGELAAGSVNGTPAEPGPGTRTVVDTNGIMSISGGVLVVNGMAAATDRYHLGSQARVPGKVLLLTLPAVTTIAGAGSIRVGWAQTAGGSDGVPGIDFQNTTNLRVKDGGNAVVSSIGFTVPLKVALILKATGGYVFQRVNGQWLLLFVTLSNSTATLYPQVVCSTASNNNFQVDDFRVPDVLYTVPCTAYDTFTRANGALGSSETTGPDGQAVTARAWTGATWAIVSNAAVNTPTPGADVIVNGNFATDTDWTKGSGWTIAGGVGVATSAADNSAISELVLTIGAWYAVQYTISGYVAGAVRGRVGGGTVGPSRSANGTYNETGRATSSAAGVLTSGVTTLNVDDISYKPLTLSELFASLQVSTADMLADVNVTGPTATAGIQAGLVLNLDSAATPANFVIAYLDGKGNCLLDKCVAGVYTNVISAAVTYSAGATLRVIKSGTSYSLFYNGAAVGTTSTISDAGIVDNTLHGLFSTSASNSSDNFTVWPRGTGGEYSGLDAY